MFPFAQDDGVLKAATNNPFDVIARDKLARLSGQRVETFIAPKNWIAKSHRSLLQDCPDARR